MCIIILYACKENLRVVGEECEDCVAVYEYNQRPISPVDTLISYKRKDKPALQLTGTVYENDGITPAANTLVYIYHTNLYNEYETADFLKDWGKKHGIIRGWVKTDQTGQYSFFTAMPTYYKDDTTPLHIHMIVKENGTTPYRLDDIYFEDDPRLTEEIIQRQKGKGGNAIVKTIEKNGILVAQKDIILGKNISNYTLALNE